MGAPRAGESVAARSDVEVEERLEVVRPVAGKRGRDDAELSMVVYFAIGEEWRCSS
jgi:hypothetical protein